ncbi:hypothetical protein ACFE04_007392 [Oxalis oulophora]
MINLDVVQLDQLKDIFTRFDMDSDGSLAILELAALLRSLGLQPSEDEIHALLSKIDANGNGCVEFDELLNAMTPDLLDKMLNHTTDTGNLLSSRVLSFNRNPVPACGMP